MKRLATTASAACALLAASAADFSVEGRWSVNGAVKRDVATTCTLSVYGSADAASPLWSTNGCPFVTDSDGYFVVGASASASGIPDTFWVGVAPSGHAEFSPRFRVAPAPFALSAVEAELVKSDAGLSVSGVATIDRLEVSGDLKTDEWTVSSGGSVDTRNLQLDNIRLTGLDVVKGGMLGLFNARGSAPQPDYDGAPADVSIRADVNVYRSGLFGYYLHADTKSITSTSSYSGDGFVLIAFKADPKNCPAARITVKVGQTTIHNNIALGSDRGGVVKRFMSIPYRSGESVYVALTATGYSDSVDNWWGGDDNSYKGYVGAKIKFVKFGRD